MALQKHWEVMRSFDVDRPAPPDPAHAKQRDKVSPAVAGPFASQFAAEAWIAAQPDGENFIPREIESTS
jgi:hypothetical protein